MCGSREYCGRGAGASNPPHESVIRMLGRQTLRAHLQELLAALFQQRVALLALQKLFQLGFDGFADSGDGFIATALGAAPSVRG